MEDVLLRDSVISPAPRIEAMQKCIQCGGNISIAKTPNRSGQTLLCPNCYDLISKGGAIPQPNDPMALTTAAAAEKAAVPAGPNPLDQIIDNLKPFIGMGLACAPFVLIALGWLIFHHSAPEEVSPLSTPTISVAYDKFRDWTDVTTGSADADDANSAHWALLGADED